MKKIPEHNNVWYMMYLVGNIVNSVEVFIVCLTCSCDFSNACLFNPKNSCFIGCDVDETFREVSTEIIVELYAHQLLKPESSFTGSGSTFLFLKCSFIQGRNFLEVMG